MLVIDGKYVCTFDLNNHKLHEFEKHGFKSWVYMCTDIDTDCSFEGGFAARNTNMVAVHFPVNTADREFSQNDADLQFPWQRILLYKKFEEVMDSLPTPAVLSCRSSTRASALLTCYKAVKQGLSKDQAMQWAQQNVLKFLSSEKVVAWVGMIIDHFNTKNKLIFRQLFEPVSSTYTYLLADAVTKEALLIDPVLETVDRDLAQLNDLGLKLKYCVNTHVHADHITGSGLLKEKTGSLSAISVHGNAVADIHFREFDALQIGTWKIYCVATPGHTNGCTSFVLDDLSRVFTGDAMLIRGCGRTDFQQGSASTLYHSIHDKLFRWLPDSCALYSGHDYKGLTVSSIWEEKKYNPRLTKTEEEFINIMNNLNLPPPKKLAESVPANLVDGVLPPK